MRRLERARSAWLRAPLGVGLALFALALLLRLYRLDAQSLWLDEGSSWELSRLGWAQLLRELVSPSAAYPLYHLLLKAWTALLGDSEWALRLPSALAGAAAVPLVYLAGVELERLSETRSQGDTGARGQGDADRLPPSPPLPLPPSFFALAASTIALAAPYAIWYGQEAKVYGLLLLCAAAICWLTVRALRTGARRDWLWLASVCVIALFVHRLAALLVIAVGWASLGAGGRWLGAGRPLIPGPRSLRAGLLGTASVGLVAAMVAGLGGESAVTGAYIPAGPATALGLTVVRFSLDRWPGDAPWWWLAPWAALLCWGLGRALLDLRVAARRRGAAALLTLLGAPLALFLAQLLFTRVYEARYLIIVFPLWALLLAYPLRGLGAGSWRAAQMLVYLALLVAALVTGGLALFQPRFGLFSGDPVKEQYREAIGELAARVHPDDAVVIHPGYIRPLYNYYMGRLTADPAPEPLTFGNFWRGPTAFGQREWDVERRQKLAGYTRSFLLIAPNHARTVDVPLPGDEYGLLGNYWAFSREQGTWPCGIWRFNGAHLLCQEAPEAYETGLAPAPASSSEAIFGGALRLLGFTLKATTPDGPGVYRAGGVLPISLFWDVAAQQREDLSLFLHLCQRCDVPPAAGDDGPPLEGYLPTSSWLPGKPARDDRAIALPRDLAPGRYTLLLGLYRPGDASEAGRLTVTGGETIGADRLILGTVEIVAGE